MIQEPDRTVEDRPLGKETHEPVSLKIRLPSIGREESQVDGEWISRPGGLTRDLIELIVSPDIHRLTSFRSPAVRPRSHSLKKMNAGLADRESHYFQCHHRLAFFLTIRSDSHSLT